MAISRASDQRRQGFGAVLAGSVLPFPPTAAIGRRPRRPRRGFLYPSTTQGTSMSNVVRFQDLDQWSRRARFAMRAGAFLCVLTLTGVIYTHVGDRDAVPATSTTSAPKASAPEAPATPYYLPSQYELKATEPAEPIQTF